MRLAGHIHRHPELVANRLLLWEPNHGVRSRGRPAMTYVDSLRVDTGLSDTGEMRGPVTALYSAGIEGTYGG